MPTSTRDSLPLRKTTSLCTPKPYANISVLTKTDSATRDHTFQRISALTRHLTYSAQLDPIEQVRQKIGALLNYSESLSMEKTHRRTGTGRVQR